MTTSTKTFYKVGIGHTPEYQSSGWPWVTGSILQTGQYWTKIEFPRVTKSFTIINLDAGHMHPSGSLSGSKELIAFFGGTSVSQAVQPQQITKNHYVTIPENKNGFVFDVKTDHVFVGCHDTSSVGGFQVFAELTGISSLEMLHLTGSGIDQ
jgi:hypothetical protein